MNALTRIWRWLRWRMAGKPLFGNYFISEDHQVITHARNCLRWRKLNLPAELNAGETYLLVQQGDDVSIYAQDGVLISTTKQP